VSVLDHTESAFEKLIVSELITAGGWDGEDPAAGLPTDYRNYDGSLGLYPNDLIAFVAQTQAKAWSKLTVLGGSEPNARTALLKRVADQLDRRDPIDVLRGGLNEKGIKLRLAYFEPELKVDPRAQELYEANRLRVVRQIRFDPTKGDSVDLVMFVNGIPTATAELKNRYTHQTVDDAIKQYREDRDPKNVLFGRRAFVHFAVDADHAYMTTRLDGTRTRFLPFNQGSGGAGQPGGKGNPGDPAGGHPTSYLWRQVWERDSWMELIEKFVFVENPTKDEAKTGARPTVIFPRFHQWDVVRDCAAHARVHGPGQRYLIQHSAGSGKSKEIAWLAHDLSTIHSAEQRKIFDKVIVITDRRVLDQQLQAQVKAFEQVRGTVQQINEDSAQLRAALEGEQARVIITTLQKFPFVLKALTDDVATLKDRTYAVIVDEAHSSQTGESATDLKKVLGARTPEDLGLDDEERDGVLPELLAQLAGRGHQPNLSFFAFTATPKAKTLELFGTPGPDGTARAFHTYSMRQAVEEGFILDVLRNYTTYEQLYRLESAAGEIEVPKGKAAARLAQFARFHPYAKDQKAAVIVEHYRTVVRKHLGGQAKAMVVTASREEAVRYKQAIDRYVAKHSYDDVRSLVAFSGEVTIKDPEAVDAGESYTEPRMNLIAGKPLPEAGLPTEFAKPEYGVLIVAEKYQTGFDQPKLVAMYIDKKLAGVNAVQTLSRLNRTHPDKDTTYVLDFVNDSEEIRKAFEPFFGRTEATPTDPNVLFDAAQKLRDLGLIDDADLDAFAAEYYRGVDASHASLSGATQAAFDRAQELDDEQLDGFRDALDRFVRFYAFLAQVVPHLPPETEKLYVFSRFLALRLMSGRVGGGLSVDVDLTHYRLEEIGTASIGLTDDQEPLTAITSDGTGSPRGQGELPMGVLGELVELFNERFGGHLTEADAVHPAEGLIDHIDRTNQDTLADQAKANDFDDFLRDKEKLVIAGALTADQASSDFFRGVLDDEDFRTRATYLAMRVLYDRYRSDS
jgi:type I restriction enzyme R subunit